MQFLLPLFQFAKDYISVLGDGCCFQLHMIFKDRRGHGIEIDTEVDEVA